MKKGFPAPKFESMAKCPHGLRVVRLESNNLEHLFAGQNASPMDNWKCVHTLDLRGTNQSRY